MSTAAPRTARVADAIRDLGCDLVSYVPSNSIAPIITRLQETDPGTATGRRTVFPVSREEEAVGIVGALPLAGRFGAIVMQDNGFGNSLTALTTFPAAYHLPMLIVANTRGGLGEYNSMIHTISAAVPQMLTAAGIAVFGLDRRTSADDWRATVHEAGRHARMTHRPVVVLMEFFDGGQRAGGGEGSAA